MELDILTKFPLAKKVDSTVPKNRWVASLSNGETIYDDNKKNAPSAWERLKLYLDKNNLNVTMLRLQINNEIINLPRNAEGYIQKKS